MSADTEQQENDSSAVETEARTLGWAPKDDFKGDPSKWVDAETFVERGKNMVPLLRAQNEKLSAAQVRQQHQLNELTKQLTAAKDDFVALQEFQNETITRRVEETRKKLKAQIKEARQNDDVDGEIEATDRLQQLNTASKDAEAELQARKIKGKKENEQRDAMNVPLDEHAKAWLEENPWFFTDAVRKHKTVALAYEIDGDMPGLKGAAYFAELTKRLSGETRPGKSKVESSRGGTTGASSGGRTYADLPAESKAACDRQAERFVKKDGQFKTTADYRTYYIKQLEAQGYFSEGR